MRTVGQLNVVLQNVRIHRKSAKHFDKCLCVETKYSKVRGYNANVNFSCFAIIT